LPFHPGQESELTMGNICEKIIHKGREYLIPNARTADGVVSGYPGETYIDIPITASGQTFLAPDDGFVHMIKRASGAGQYITMFIGVNTDAGASLSATDRSEAGTPTLHCKIPVSRGQTVFINYTAGGVLSALRFIPAKKFSI
jgi:hypothetical protein